MYELAILGNATDDDRRRLSETITSMIAPFGLTPRVDINYRDGNSTNTRNTHFAFAAAYFGGSNQTDTSLVEVLVKQNVPVIPIIGPNGTFGSDIPAVLHATNGMRLRADDYNMTEPAVAMLECVGLLRRQRRAFISYRRTESRLAAMQLHDLLSARGFDVFLDTHDIMPGEPFQDVLWNRLCDSDVMVMLDTPSYFDSKWTRQEMDGPALRKYRFSGLCGRSIRPQSLQIFRKPST